MLVNLYHKTMENTNEKKSTGTANSSGSPVSKDSGFEKAMEKNPNISTEEDGRTKNPFSASNPDASTTPGGAPEAAGTGTGSPHISENPDKQ